MKIDAHIHSTFSDGTYGIEEIIKKAKENKVDLIALTDHNNLDGISEFAKLTNEYNQSALAGIEISSIYDKVEIHLLGYFPINSNFFYAQYDNLNKLNNNYKNGKREQLEEIIENIGKDYDVSVNDFYNFISKIKDDKNFNRVHIANYLIHKNIATSIQDGFNRFLNDDSKYYVFKKQTQLLEAVDAMVQGGGLPVIAHLSQYKLTDNEIKKMLIDVSKITKDFGIELFHYDHSKSDINRYLKIVNEVKNETNANIVFSAGSDCHGKNKPNEIGFPYNFSMDKETKNLYQNICNDFVTFLKDKQFLKENIKENEKYR